MNNHISSFIMLFSVSYVVIRQMQEKFRGKGKKLCFVFVDLEKNF